MSQKDTDRPHVIVHMTSSVDGRIQTRRWSRYTSGSHYEDVHNALGGDAWMCGRITMQGYTRGQASSTTPTRHPSPALTISRAATHPAMRSPSTRMRACTGARATISRATMSSSCCRGVCRTRNLNALRAAGISYLFGGRAEIDFALVLSKLKRHLGIGRLLVEGGGGINGSLLAAGLVDELSLLLAPSVDGGRGIPAVFGL